MFDCIFCKIVERAADALIIYEDDRTIGFLPLEPAVAGHTLMVPKAHYSDVYAIPEALDSALMTSCKTLALHWREHLGSTGLTCCTRAARTRSSPSFTSTFTCFLGSRAMGSARGLRCRIPARRAKRCTPRFRSSDKRGGDYWTTIVPWSMSMPHAYGSRPRDRCAAGSRPAAPSGSRRSIFVPSGNAKWTSTAHVSRSCA